MLAFFILLICYFPKLKNFEDYFVYSATALFSLHFWYGATFFIKTVEPTKNIFELLLDFLILGLKIGSIYTIIYMPLWFLVNALFMGLGVVKYNIALKRERSKEKQKFIYRKISIEISAVLAFFILAILTWMVDIVLLRKILSVVVLGVQMPFLYLLFFKKAIYKAARSK
jgi:hypothetical protein